MLCILCQLLNYHAVHCDILSGALQRGRLTFYFISETENNNSVFTRPQYLKNEKLTSSHSDVKEGVLSEFPFEHCGFGVGSLQLLLAFLSFGGWVIRLESDLETLLHKCISSKVFGKDRILPSVHARSTNPPVVITHCSLILGAPTRVWFSAGLFLVWNMVLFTIGGFFFLTGGSELLSFRSCICCAALLLKMLFSSGPLHGFTLLYSWSGFSGGSHAGDDPWSKPANCSAGCPSGSSLSVDASPWQSCSEMTEYLVNIKGW